MIEAFIETTWFLWWLLAAAIILWWSWGLFGSHGIRPGETHARWRDLYRQALDERDEVRRGIRIQDAEGAILSELANHIFTANSTERKALQEARDNLYSLRQIRSEPEKNRVA